MGDRVVLALLALLVCARPFASASPSTKTVPPTIVHVIADDLGYNDLGSDNGGKTHTPNIDSLRKDGIDLTDYSTFKVCAPSRASLLTGRLACDKSRPCCRCEARQETLSGAHVAM